MPATTTMSRLATSVLIGEQSALYGMPRRLQRVAETVNYAAASLSFGSSVSVQYHLAFDKQSDAEDCKEVLESDSENGINWRLRWEMSLSRFARWLPN